MDIKKICVLGAGLMGNGIAQACAQAGYQVMLRDIEQGFVDKGMETIRKNLERNVKKGKMDQMEMGDIFKRITPTLDLKEAGDGADIAVEVIIEIMDIKKKVYAELGKIVPSHCLFFTNTSGLSITELAAVTDRPDKFIGTHFFYPVIVMKLLEIIKGHETSKKPLTLQNNGEKHLARKPLLWMKHQPLR